MSQNVHHLSSGNEERRDLVVWLEPAERLFQCLRSRRQERIDDGRGHAIVYSRVVLLGKGTDLEMVHLVQLLLMHHKLYVSSYFETIAE